MSVRAAVFLRLLSLVLFAGTLLSGCKRNAPDSSTAPGAAPGAVAPAQILRLAQRNEPVSLDPATTALPDEFGILRAFYEGLLLPGPDGTAPVPGAAESFAVSADGLVYTFRLRPDARWSDGVPVTAAHFVASFRRTLAPATAAPKANVFYGVKNARAFNAGRLADFAAVGFRAPDAATLEIVLESPNPRFPYTVASGPWLPIRADLAVDPKALADPARFVGNGPFLLKEWRPDQRVVAVKNPRWHGASAVKLQEIRWLRFDSGDSEERAYRAGQLDATMSMPFAKVASYAAEKPAELQRSPMLETRYLAFNTRRHLLADPRVRLALALAIDRARICERVLQGGQQPAGVLIPDRLRTAPASATLAYAHGFAPDRARALVAESGVDPAKLNGLELSFWSNPAALEAIQEMWRRELGVRVQLVQREARVHLDALRSGHFDVGFVTIIADVADPLAFVEDFTGTGGENYPQLQDAEFDRHLAARRPEAAEQRLLELAALTPLYFNTKIFLLSPAVRGWHEDALWGRTYRHMSLVAR